MALKCPFVDTSSSKVEPQKHSGLPLLFIDEYGRIIMSRDALPRCLEREFDLKRLEDVYGHLWWAGRPVPAKALHQQKMLRREIVPTQRADFHLVRTYCEIFIKPLPGYMLDSTFWNDHLLDDVRLNHSATGYLLSWVWLIRHEIDLNLAHELKLVPNGLHWEEWVHFVESMSLNFDFNKSTSISKRYHYGELRMSRLNQIYRLRSPLSFQSFIFAYGSSYDSYHHFFRKNFGWIFVIFAYATVLLSALQVGVAVDRLASKSWFQSLSLILTLISMVLPLLTGAFVAVLFVVLFVFHMIKTISFQKKRERL
jgi:uncharacterized protein DUF6601